MEPVIATTEDTEITEAFASLPEEVQDFMASSEFEASIKNIQKALSLSDEQTQMLEIASYELLTETATMEDIAKGWQAKNVPNDLIVKMLYAIHQGILVPAANITEFFTDDTEEETADTVVASSISQQSAPSPADVLATLKERLQEAKVVAPTTRDQSMRPAPTPKASSDAARSVDPYRELPE